MEMRTIQIECPECYHVNMVEMPINCGMFDLICENCKKESHFVGRS